MNQTLIDYQKFLASKHVSATPSGFKVAVDEIPASRGLFPFQRDIVRWACWLGRAAIFAEVGMGKTRMQLVWADLVNTITNGKALILCPLAVAPQTVLEGESIGIAVKEVRNQDDVGDARIVITNYENVHNLDVNQFQAIVLDEASILKHYTKTFFALTALFEHTPYKLLCTATPSPNDIVELGNYSTFLGVMDFHDMLARWFVGEGDVARKARLKGYAVEDFYRWLTSWAVGIRHPRDLGPQYDMDGYDRPALHIREHELPLPEATIKRHWEQGRLLPDSPNATAFQQVKRESLEHRVAQVLEIVESIDPTEPVIIWCDTDFEADALMKAIPEAVEVRGSYSPQKKRDGLDSFTLGEKRMVITKAEVAGYGLNWQHCRHMVFAGVSFSFERTYQALGRIHRYGQKRECFAHFVYAQTEGSVRQLLQDKQESFIELQQQMSAAIRKHGLFREEKPVTVFTETEHETVAKEDWTMHLGDCVPVMVGMKANSVHLSVSSPPFSSLYTYSDKEADAGNCESSEEFFEHYAFVIRELLRITVPGRVTAVHVKDLPLFINRDGVQGIDPFSDDVTAAFRKARLASEADLPEREQTRWVLQSRITIGKDPVIEMQKTNSHGLLFKNWRMGAQNLRVGLPDYVLVFRKWVPGADETPVLHDPTNTTYHGENPPVMLTGIPSRRSGARNDALPVWQRYANPIWDDVAIPAIWDDIQQTKVLNSRVSRTSKDGRHICPLQLDLIARLVDWYTNPGEVVLDPFAGIGSTPYEAVRIGRKGVGIELKPEYFRLAVTHLNELTLAKSQMALPLPGLELEMA